MAIKISNTTVIDDSRNLTNLVGATISGAVTLSTTTDDLNLGTSQTTGLVTIGGTAQTGAIAIGRSTKTQNVEISNGITESAQTNTVLIANSGATGSTTNITIGSTAGTSTTTLNGLSKYTSTDGLSSATSAGVMNLNLSDSWSHTVSGTTSFSFTNVPTSGRTKFVVLEITNGGSATVNWPTNTRWPNGSAPTLTTSGVDVVVFFTDDGGANWRASLAQKDSK